MGLIRLLLFASLGALFASAATPTKIFPLPYDQHDLPNGLRLITIPTDYPNVVSVYIVVQTGSRNEVEAGKTGFAHFFEHLMFRGTDLYPPARYESTLRSIGASSNAFTSDDITAYHTTFSKEDLDQVLGMEADRFQNLKYPQDAFRTEALAVLGEYNKNSANPVQKLFEVLRNTAFSKHTYKHTTMGFLEDVQDMPNEFEYSKTFFDRYYRPEYTTILVVGDVDPKAVRPMVTKHWGEWKKGTYKAPVPAEPPQEEAKRAHVDWKSQTLPWVAVAYRASAYADTEKDSAALDLLSFLGFSENSDLYQRLVVQQQKVDALSASNPDRVDPYLFTVLARVKKEEDVKDVEAQILATFNGFKDTMVPAAKLESVKKRLRYQFALRMDNSESIAQTVAIYVGLRRTPETMNKLHDVYAELTPEQLRDVARKYFVDKSRTIVTLAGPKQ